MGKIRGKWEEGDMIFAVNNVRDKKMTIREASDRFSVPKSTLADRLKTLKDGKEIPLKVCTANRGTWYY